MIDQFLLDILIKKFRERETNPKTGKVFALKDIKKENYKQEVIKWLKENNRYEEFKEGE